MCPDAEPRRHRRVDGEHRQRIQRLGRVLRPPQASPARRIFTIYAQRAGSGTPSRQEEARPRRASTAVKWQPFTESAADRLAQVFFQPGWFRLRSARRTGMRPTTRTDHLRATAHILFPQWIADGFKTDVTGDDGSDRSGQTWHSIDRSYRALVRRRSGAGSSQPGQLTCAASRSVPDGDLWCTSMPSYIHMPGLRRLT